jgi:DNA-directed RNA polymerase beta subunit
MLDLCKIYGEMRFASRLLSAISSGVWSNIRKGVSIALNTNNDDAITSQLRRISSALIATDGAHSIPRNVAADQFGFICAASTPDGDTTGLIYERAIVSTVSPPGVDILVLEQLLLQAAGNGVIRFLGNDACMERTDYLYVDPTGRMQHAVSNPSQVLQAWRELRRSGAVTPFVFFHLDSSTRLLRATCQEGILCRPLLVVRTDGTVVADSLPPGRRRLVWAMEFGAVEYISPAEQVTCCCIETSRCSIVPGRTTHLELTQASFLGLAASGVPYVTSQQGPRLAYFTSQKRQIITASNKVWRGSTTTTRMWEAHRPLVRTRTAVMSGDAEDGMRGTPVVIAFLAMPQNQEDAIVFKRSTLERGAFNASTIRHYISETSNPSSSTNERFERPTNIIGTRAASYEHILADGLPAKGTFIPGGDVIIGKTKSSKKVDIRASTLGQVTKRVDISTVSRRDEGGVVESARKRKLLSGHRVEVSISTTRNVVVGDKFSSSYAQKGVVGAILPDEDMPFSMQTGMIPDIVVSPLSMTSRMTMGSLIEALVGKSICVSCDRDGTGIDEQNFTPEARQDLVNKAEHMLVTNGFSRRGTELYVDGRTGLLLKTRVFVGCVDYFRLVHLASKKIHARATGPRDPLTRQPKDGRRYGGGLRIGEMEGCALAAHGCSRILQERVRELSDAFDMYICTTCGLPMDDANEDIGYAFCRGCQSHDGARHVLIPFTFLILLHELLCMGISVKFTLRDVGSDCAEQMGLNKNIQIVDGVS